MSAFTMVCEVKCAGESIRRAYAGRDGKDHTDVVGVIARLRSSLLDMRLECLTPNDNGGLDDGFEGFDEAGAVIDIVGIGEIPAAIVFDDVFKAMCETGVNDKRSSYATERKSVSMDAVASRLAARR